MAYRPLTAPTDPAQAMAYVSRELQRIQAADNDLRLVLPMKYLDVAPTKPQDGLYLSAANVLGVTRGLYRYDSSTETYTLIS